MSPATEELIRELTPFFEVKGFKLLKSKTTFIKVKGELEFKVVIKLDGRGGLTMVDWVHAEIAFLDIGKICKKTFGFTIPIWYKKINYYKNDDIRTLQIPMMYSKKALDIANEMNLKKLGELSFAEKYPPERIKNCARVIENLLIDKLIFKNFDNEYTLFGEYEKYDDLLLNPKLVDENGQNPFYSLFEDVYYLNEVFFMYFLLLLNKLKIPYSNNVRNHLEKISDYNKQILQKIIL